MAAYLPPPAGELPVIFADDWLIVANKPSGLLSVPGRGPDKQDCLVSRLQTGFADVLVAHRLDMSTSGLLVLARGEAMQRYFFKQFRERQVAKRYLAVVAGQVADAAGEIDLPLIVDWPNRPRQKVDFETGKPSLTRFRVDSRDPHGDTTRLALEPVTGRTHQLRVHLATLGHPILGDDLYGGEAAGRADRLLLHAVDLAFVHPATGRTVEFHCAPDF